jgi:hypothetical protein
MADQRNPANRAGRTGYSSAQQAGMYFARKRRLQRLAQGDNINEDTFPTFPELESPAPDDEN